MSKRATVGWVVKVGVVYVGGWVAGIAQYVERQCDAERHPFDRPLQAKATAAMAEGRTVRIVAKGAPSNAALNEAVRKAEEQRDAANRRAEVAESRLEEREKMLRTLDTAVMLARKALAQT